MSNERISILLEILSFLFVTTDLYGEERLGILETNAKIRLVNATNKLKSKKVFTWGWLVETYNGILKKSESGVISFFLLVIGFCVWIPLMMYDMTQMSKFLHPMIGENSPFMLICLVCSLLTSAIIVLLLYFPLSIFPYLLMLFIDLIQFVIILSFSKLFKKIDIQGVGIYIGTILFLISKALIF